MQHSHEMKRKNNSQERNVGVATFRAPDLSAVEKRIGDLLPISVSLARALVDVPQEVFDRAVLNLKEAGSLATREFTTTGKPWLVDRRRLERYGHATPKTDEQKREMTARIWGGRR